MNPLLEEKIQKLDAASDYECWYLVKQPTAFDKLCYLVSFLKEYQSKGTSENIEDFIRGKINEIKRQKPNIEITDNYRSLRVAAFFGLIIMKSGSYANAVITETFSEITIRCGGNYENTGDYSDIIQRQIEKMFLSSPIDEAYQGVRQEYRLYPVMLLYKILIELGRAAGSYTISMTEYRYLVATTKRFEDFLDTLLLIRLLREERTAESKFESFRTKFDNRLIQALKQLDTLQIDVDSISLKQEAIKEAAHKVYLFEENPNIFCTENYLSFLGSVRSLFELEDKEEKEEAERDFDKAERDLDKAERDLDKAERLTTGVNVLLYGVPGSGKSWTIEHEYCRKESHVERLVFHADYTYSDFVGQILPDVSEEGQVRYRFTPGPFTGIMRDAFENPLTEYILVIEEINRGNAPAIFGEVFQLLDRKTDIKEKGDDGYPIRTSEYGITNKNMALEIYGHPKHKVRIPSNLSIIGTMNTSDQNVFTLDTAFQRRWEMRLIENSFEHVNRALAKADILDTGITWESFCVSMNEIIIGNNAGMISSEDKRLGAYFVHLHDLQYDSMAEEHSKGEYRMLCEKEHTDSLKEEERKRLVQMRDAMRQNRRFPEKVIKYLWDDAFKFSREIIFETIEYQSLEVVIRKFMQAKGWERFTVFKQNVRDALQANNIRQSTLSNQ